MYIRVTLLALLVATGCDKKKEAGSDTKSAPTAESKPVVSKRKDINGEPVDVCSQISTDKVEAIIGKTKDEPQAVEGQGSMLGQCSWFADTGFAFVSTRPANEYEGTVEYAEDAKEVSGIGEKAYSTKAGLLIKAPGKQYMLQVAVMGGDESGEKTKALAKLALEQLK